MYKRILFILIFLVLVIHLVPVFSEAGTVGEEAGKTGYTLISSKELSHVNELLRSSIKKLYLDAKETYLEYDSPQAKKYIKELNIKFVPFIIYDNSIAATDTFFHMVRNNMIDKVDGYYVIPERQLKSGEIMFLDREREPSKLYIYAMGFCPYSKEAEATIIDLIKQNKLDININVKYLVHYSEFGISSPRGPDEIREDIREIVIQEYYPDQFLDYLTLIQTKEPDEALKELKIPAEIIDSKKDEALGILKADYEESEVLGIRRSPTFLW